MLNSPEKRLPPVRGTMLMLAPPVSEAPSAPFSWMVISCALTMSAV